MHFDPLPRTWIASKPKDRLSYDPRKVIAKARAGQLIIQIKDDGYSIRSEICEGRRVRMYTSGMEEIDSRLDYLREEILETGLPPGTVLVGELKVPSTLRGDREAVQSIIKSEHIRAAHILGRGPLPEYRVFAMPFLDYNSLSSWPYWAMLDRIQEKIRIRAYVHPAQVWTGTLSQARRHVRKHKIEGLVLYDAFYHYTWCIGKSVPRPDGCYKWKDHYEDDFIVFRRHRRLNPNGTLHDVMLMQWDKSERKLFYCGRLSKFDKVTRELLVGDSWDCLVMEASFMRRFEKTGKLCEPSFVRLRDDKDPDACLAPALWPEPEFVS